MNKESKIFVAGHNGLVGSALVRRLLLAGYSNIITKSRSELDLTNQHAVEVFFADNKPEYVFLAAAKVGGIHANSVYPAEFIFSNMQIQMNIINECWKYKTKKLLFLGSSCIYPKFAPQPIKEEALLSGYLEPSNEAYAIAKIAGIMMCQSYNIQYGTEFISAMPTNLYGKNDNYHPINSHVLPALIRRFHAAKVNNLPKVTIWGTGIPTREFLYSDDLADACIFLMESHKGNDIVNIGTGQEISIKNLAELIKNVVGYEGKIDFDKNKLDGTPRKLTDCSRIHKMGWHHSTSLEKGLELTYADFRKKRMDK